MADHVDQKLSTTSRFTRSVNLQQDLWESESLRGYLVTAGARRVLLRLAPARHTPGAARAWTLTGPYGTGKSALALFAAKLLASDLVPGNAAAYKLLRACDAELAQQIRPPRKPVPALLPIVVTGSREPLQLSLLRGLETTMSHLHGRRRSHIADRISAALAQAVAGKQPSGHAVTELFSDTLRAVSAGNTGFGGFFLIVDELGKLLEYAAAHPTQSDLYTLQSLAEFAARSAEPFLILGVLHQDFALYSDRLTARERAEWDKIRGRFEDIAFEEPADELLRLIAEARSPSTGPTELSRLPPARKTQFRTLCKLAWTLQLAPSRMTKKEFFGLLARCYPLHPLVAVVLGPLFRKLAQNERSVFSFLESSEPHGLREHQLRADGHLYCLHHLYDYLLGSVGEGLYVQLHGKRWAEIETVLARLPRATPLDIAVVKTIGLLGAMGQWRDLVATEKILRLALHESQQADVHHALRGLKKESAITHRRYNKSFALWEGSDIDLDERLRAARARIGSSTSAATLAAQFLAPRPLVAKRHSFETGSLRYFEVHFVGPVQFSEVFSQPRGPSDGQILILLPDRAVADNPVGNLERDPRLADRPDLLAVVPADFRSLEDTLHELASLEWIRANTPELEGDATARRELRARIAAVRRQLDEMLTVVLSPADADPLACTWFHGGHKLRITSRRTLQEHLSQLCDDTYVSTPRIRNELINRRELSSAAAAARRNLIEAMIQHGDQSELGIEGTPPEKSMYLSVLRQTGIHRKSGDAWHFGGPHRNADEGTRKVWAAINEYFAQSEREAQPVVTLYERLAAPPFGMLAGPMPVLLCAALLANDARVALYEDGSFVPQLNTATCERLLRAPERFAIQQWRLTGVRTTVFHRLAELLDLKVSDMAPDKGDILTVVRPLCRFVTRLNEYARRTQRISPAAQQIREHLSTATRPDKLVFEDLPKACGTSSITPRAQLAEKDLTHFITALRDGLSELHHCYDELLDDLTRGIGQAFGIEGARSAVREKLANRAEAIRDWVADPALKSFVLRVADRALDDLLWLESVVALLSQKPPSGWRDDDRAKFEVALMKTARLFAHLEGLAFASPHSHDQQRDEDSIRIGITTRTSPELERVIHVPGEDKETVIRLQAVVRRALADAGVNGNGQIAAAALARLMQELLEQ